MRFFKLNDDPPPCARAPACTRMCVPAHIREDLLKQINLLMAKPPRGVKPTNKLFCRLILTISSQICGDFKTTTVTQVELETG